MLSEQVPYYIIDLLQQSPSVDIRGLGRFEAIFHPAVVDAGEAKIRPPSLKPDFQERQIDQHQLLSAYITYVSGASPGIADQAIDDFVSKVQHETITNGQYAIDQFGTFTRSESNSIRFTPDWDAFNLSFRGLDVIDLQERKEVPQEITPPLVTPPLVTPPVLTPTSVEIDSTVIPKSEETDKVIPLPEIRPVQPSTSSPIDENTSRLWWIILVSALLLITVLCAYLAWDIISNRKRLNELASIYTYTDTIPGQPLNDTAQIIDSTALEVQPLPTDTQSAPSVKEEPKVTPPPVEEKPVDDGTYCYVVVGAFADPANVVRMEERLSSMGYTSEQLKGRTITRVGIRTSCDKETLQRVLSEARASINPESWIY